MLKKSYNYILILLIIFEHLFLFVLFKFHITSQTVNSAGFFIVSVLIGIVLLLKFYNVPEISINQKIPVKRKYFLILFYAVCFLVVNGLTIRIIKTIDYSNVSDIIPAITIMSKAFLSGNFPYAPTIWESLGYSGPPGYLPMHWLPFTVADYFHFDSRTMTFAIWCLGAVFIMFRSLRCKDLWLQIAAPLLLLGSYALMASIEPGVIGVTVEIMIAGYYMLLMAGINQKNVVLAGLFISFCLLSRYYVVLWLPLWAFVLFVSGNRKKLFITILVITATVIIVYIIPFLSKNWYALYDSFKDYETYPLSEWRHLNGDNRPWHLYYGFGFAHLFYEKYLQTDIVIGYRLLKNVFYGSIGGVLVIMGLWYWFNRKKIDHRIFLLASFKIYLAVFQVFILVPYMYLMITACFVSVAIFAEQARYNLPEKK